MAYSTRLYGHPANTDTLYDPGPSGSVLPGFERSVFDSPGKTAYSHEQWKTIAYPKF